MTATEEPTAVGAYTEGRVRSFLRDYQRYAQNARPPANEERLGSRPPPADEASWSATARMKADIEGALQAVSWWKVQVTFMNLSLGDSDWRHSIRSTGEPRGHRQSGWRDVGAKDRSAVSWREKVGDWWGLTAGEVTQITDEVVGVVVTVLNC
jgi:hypothetical protein